MQQHYDYIIAGAGCAGLSLLRRMMLYPFFAQKKILLLDKAPKNSNDRTWCFWEQKPGVFEEIVFHRWQQIDFYSNYFSARFDLQPYQYKMIRGMDLYTTVLNEASQRPNIDIVFDEVKSISNHAENATVTADGNTYTADRVFNSILINDWKQKALQQKNIYVLQQHFKGWLIETKQRVFTDRIATFMDFRTNQEKGTAFVYVLPVADNKALVEYTLFSENLLPAEDYDTALQSYIHEVLNIKKYNLLHTEYGVIPMTNYHFSEGEERTINIGTAGGQTKGSSGYSFQFIQKHSDDIIAALLNNENPLRHLSLSKKRFKLYDGILLNVLKNKKMSGEKLFTQLFKKNAPQLILKFLDNGTAIKEELKIMNSVSLDVFLPAALKQIF